MLDIIGVGDTNVDVMIQVPNIPMHDEKARGKLVGNYPGGITANFCSAAAALGAKVGAVCKVGRDDYGKMAFSDLQARGIDVSHMVIDPECETYFCMVLLDATGEKALTIVETSGFLPHPAEIDVAYLKTARWVHMTTLDMELTAWAARELEGSGTMLSLDIEATAGDCTRELWDEVLGRTAIAFPNEAGLEALTGCKTIEEGAKQMLVRGVKLVVVTCGADGVRIYHKKGSVCRQAYRVPVKDTTGAGDCFNGAFLTGITKGWSLERCARFACAAAAISIGSVGARTGIPVPAQVQEFLEERGEGICD